MISEAFHQQVSTGGLRFEAYLPPSLASWVIRLVDQGVFHSPSEAVFVAMQTFEELEQHPEVKEALLRAMITQASKTVEKERGIPPEEVMAEIEAMDTRPLAEPAVWDRSMNRPLFEDSDL
jgi:Arc/MetJ-type ribon-helix-helix transcriptional regulator